VGGGPGAAEQAALVAYELVSAGDAEHALVVLCDDAGAVTRDLCAAAGIANPASGARARVLAAGNVGRLVEPPVFALR